MTTSRHEHRCHDLDERAGSVVSRTTLPPETSSVPVARHWAAELARGAGCDAATARTLALVVAELASNAVKHAASEFTVELDITVADDGFATVRVGVSDEDSRLPRIDDVDSGTLGGRGLYLVQSLADSFGVEPHLAGKTVWACLSSSIQIQEETTPTGPPATSELQRACNVVAVLESAAELVRSAEALTADAATEPSPDEADEAVIAPQSDHARSAPPRA